MSDVVARPDDEVGLACVLLRESDLLECPDGQIAEIVAPFASPVFRLGRLLASAAHDVPAPLSLSADCVVQIDVQIC